MNRPSCLALLLVVASAAASGPALALPGKDAIADAPEAPTAPQFARVSGLVRYTGRDPLKLKTFSNDVDVAACGTRVASRAVQVGRNGALADVFVELRTPDGALVAGAKLAPAETPLSVDLTACNFEPQILVVPLGSSVELREADGILHEVSGHSLRNEPVHARLPRFRRRLVLGPEHFRHGERLKLTCDTHTWSGGWWIATENRFHAVTGADGTWSIEGVPPGTYLVTARHGEFEPAEGEVVLQPGDSVRVDLEVR